MNNNKELILKSLAHLNVIKLLNQSKKTYEEFIEDKIVVGFNYISFDSSRRIM